MHHPNLHLLQENYTTVGAVFVDDLDIDDLLHAQPSATRNACPYTFKVDTALGLQAGDYALVHANNTVKIVRIVAVHDAPQIDSAATYRYKWVIQKIDLSAYRRRLVEEQLLQALLDTLHAVEEKAQLQQRIERAQELDDDLRQIVARLRALQNGD